MAAIVTFDPANLRIVEINSGSPAVNELDAVEVYSEWKDWLLSDYQNQGYPPAFVQVSEVFDSATNELIGPYFYLGNGWKIRPAEYEHKLIVSGDMLSDPTTESIFTQTLGSFNVHTETKLSSIFKTRELPGGVTPAEVWEILLSTSFPTGSIGEFIKQLTERGRVG